MLTSGLKTSDAINMPSRPMTRRAAQVDIDIYLDFNGKTYYGASVLFDMEWVISGVADDLALSIKTRTSRTIAFLGF